MLSKKAHKTWKLLYSHKTDSFLTIMNNKNEVLTTIERKDQDAKYNKLQDLRATIVWYLVIVNNIDR